MRLLRMTSGLLVATLVGLGLAACHSGAGRAATAPTNSSSAAAPTTSPATTSPATAYSTTTSPTTTSSVTAPTATTARPSPATQDVRVYLLRGDKLDVAHRSVVATQGIAAAAMAELLAGPTPAETASGLATTVPAGTRLIGIDVAGGTATVDLSGGFASGGGSLSMTARLAQVTFTLTQFPTVTGVVFRLDGQPVTVFGGEGLILDHPANRASFETLTPPILVESPGPGWATQSPVRVTGSANVFEAQFQAEVTDATGAVLARQSIHATSGSGTRGSFDASIAYHLTAGGPATLSVYDTSPKDGSRVDVVQIPLYLLAA